MDLFDPTSKPKIAALEEVPADFRWMYKQGDGGFEFDAENPGVKGSLSIINTMKKTNSVVRSERDAARREKIDLSALAEYGTSPAEIAATLANNKKEWETQLAAKSVDVNQIRDGIAKEYDKKLGVGRKREEKLQTQLQRSLINDGIAAAIAEEKGTASAVKLLPPFLVPQVKLVEENEELVPRVFDSDGKVRYGSNGPMTIKELVQESKVNPDFGTFFQSEAPSGGGTKPGTTSAAAPPVRKDVNDMSPEEMINQGLPKRK